MSQVSNFGRFDRPYSCIMLRGCHLISSKENHAKNNQNLAILHQSMLALFDGHLHALHVKWFLVEFFVSDPKLATVCSKWLIFSPNTRIPRTFRRFCGLIYQKIAQTQDSSDKKNVFIHAVETRDGLKRVLHYISECYKNNLQHQEIENLLRDANVLHNDNTEIFEESPLQIARANFRCISIFDDYESIEIPTSLRCIRCENLVQELHLEEKKNQMILFSLPINWKSLYSLHFESVEPFLPIVFPLNCSDLSSGCWISFSRYRQKPHITCSRLVYALTLASKTN